MKDPLIKVYGFFEINNIQIAQCCIQALHRLCEEWYLDKDIFSQDDSMIHISYEGDYFPHEECVEILFPYINENSSGKMDFIDLEAWTLQRFFLDFEHNKTILQTKTSQTQEISKTQETNKTQKTSQTEKAGRLPYSRKSSLNHALEASQEKNGAMFIHTSK